MCEHRHRILTLIHEYSPFTLFRTAYEKYLLLYSVIQIRRKVGMIGKGKYLSSRKDFESNCKVQKLLEWPEATGKGRLCVHGVRTLTCSTVSRGKGLLGLWNPPWFKASLLRSHFHSFSLNSALQRFLNIPRLIMDCCQ